MENEQEFLLSTRFRSKRRRKQAEIEDFDKKLIAKSKELNQLNKQKRDLPMVDLIPPIQRGWRRFFVLREDVRKSKRANFYDNILQKINTTQYSSDKAFKKKKKRGGKKIYEERPQFLREIHKHELPKFKLSKQELAYFEYKIIQEVRSKKIYEKHIFVFRELWRFMLKIKPNIIDKVQVRDNVLEQRITELYNFTWNNAKNGGRLSILKGSRRKYRHWHDHNKNPLNEIAKHQLLDFLEEF